MTAGDIPYTMFFLTFIAVITLLSNLLTDILYAVVDPRRRHRYSWQWSGKLG